MSWDLEPREFDSIGRGVDLCTAIGEIIPDLLSQKTTLSNPYFPTYTTSGSVTTYTIDFTVDSVPVNFTYTSTGSETYQELIEAIVVEGNTNYGDYLYWNDVVDYADEQDMYFTVVTKENSRQTSAPSFGNIEFGTTTVQAKNGSPAVYMSMQQIPYGEYPQVIVTPIPVTSVDEKFKHGSVEVPEGSGTYYPFYETYIKANYLVVVESGDYDVVLRGEKPSAESILRDLRRRIKQDNRAKLFHEIIDATINDKWTITPSPLVADTNWYSTASTTLTLDIIDRWVDDLGDVMTKVNISGTNLTDQDTVDVSVDQVIERTDI
ncbi:hypothetical protein VPHG_00109 [Vibrio phage 11895-B1]|uniref:hypothetical protein n=1 Tax=Vibrio phage 11895-B1 TaxID=754075 RepID=UPI0002C0A74E|nr:hypothetical protein VPHG_00109 [Vibrio phage 11895-B1]AGH32176.1 hypothetical protein VPHG_00109 [Vibrio phage 11895-B1]